MCIFFIFQFYVNCIIITKYENSVICNKFICIYFKYIVPPVACPSGQFSSTSAMTACTPASAGYYVTTSGQAFQSQCGPGTYSIGGAIGCTQCLPGFLCPAGIYQKYKSCFLNVFLLLFDYCIY